MEAPHTVGVSAPTSGPAPPSLPSLTPKGNKYDAETPPPPPRIGENRDSVLLRTDLESACLTSGQHQKHFGHGRKIYKYKLRVSC